MFRPEGSRGAAVVAAHDSQVWPLLTCLTRPQTGRLVCLTHGIIANDDYGGYRCRPGRSLNSEGAESSNPPEPVIRLVPEMQLDGWACC